MKIGFIGVGKIAVAVIEGLCTSGIIDLTIYLSPRNKDKSTSLAAKYACVTRMESNQDVLNQADIIFIALLPKVAQVELAALQFKPVHTVVSLIAFMPYGELFSFVSPASSVCRAIPLPPVSLHNCPIPVFNATDEVVELFKYIGQPFIVENESQLHALWTLTGFVTPFYDLLNQLAVWAAGNGVEPQIANEYIAGLFQSLSYMAQQTNPVNFDELSKHAATTGGMNEQAGKELREQGAHQLYATTANHILKRFDR